jgi:cation diffusion facilitator family transporter
LSKRLPDAERPFGYGKELYFWSFIVSLAIFIVGGCISFYEGVTSFSHPTVEGNPVWNYAVLAFAFIFNMVSMVAALKAFNQQRGRKHFWMAVVNTKDPSTIIVLLGDVGDLFGLIVAFLGVFLGRLTHHPYYDAIASMIIGIILIGISGFLIRESKSLLMGETTSRKTFRRIIKIAEADRAITKIKKQSSMYMGPEEILLQLTAVFNDDLNTKQITDAIERVSKGIQAEFPLIKQIFIEPVVR